MTKAAAILFLALACLPVLGAEFVMPTKSDDYITMPAANITLTAIYEWKKGTDKIRFMPGSSASNIDKSVWEGANSMEGPWTAFYDIEEGTVVPQGWNEASVDMGGFRYLRWRKRKPETEGVILDLEWYRNGQKLTGTPFGSQALYPENTFQKALDGDPSTHFTWANSWPLGAYVGIDTGAQNPLRPASPVNLRIIQ